MLSNLRVNLIKSKPLRFYLRHDAGTSDEGGQLFSWTTLDLGCFWYTDSNTMDENGFRLLSRERATISIPKGNDHIDFTGCRVVLNGAVFVAEGNANTSMPENTPGLYNRSLIALRDASKGVPHTATPEGENGTD